MAQREYSNAETRRLFRIFLWKKLQIVWPILSALVLIQLALGVFAGFIENWPLGDSIYFTFVTGLTIGYGDMVPKRLLSRIAAVAIGLDGVVVVGIIAAIAVRALEETAARRND
jgi:hypothetical protein